MLSPAALVWSTYTDPDELRPVRGSSVVMPADSTPGTAWTPCSRRVKNAVVAATSRYREGGNETRAVITWRGRNPGFTSSRRARLRTIRPAATSRTTARPISATTSPLRSCCPAADDEPRAASFKLSYGRDLDDIRRAGTTPNTIP